jgi:RNA polymerase sigma factor (sigma-70 family)
VCQIPPAPRDQPSGPRRSLRPHPIDIPVRQLREEELLRLFCHHRDRGDHPRAIELWQELALRNLDRIKQLVAAFRFPGGAPLPPPIQDDAAQEAYLRAVSMGANFRESALGQFRAALRRCVHNSCMDYGRKELRHDKRTAGSLDKTYDDDGEASPYDGAIARHSLEQEALRAEDEADEDRLRESQELVGWAVAQVENDSYRAVLEMTYFEQLSADEIAARLDISADNVYARRSRGVKRLEEILRDHRP